MARSLIYHAGALGDFICTLPAMQAWRRLHRADRIALLGKSAHADIAPEGLFDEAWEAGSAAYAPLFNGTLESAVPLRERLRAFRSALLFSSSSSRLAGSLQSLGIKEIIRQDPFPKERVHVIDYHLSLFPDGIFTEEERRPSLRQTGTRSPGPLRIAALHPGSGSPKKNWPRERFLSLAGSLEEFGLSVRWVIGPAEDGFELPANAGAWRNLPLRDLAEALSACRVFVGNDSGITHLAAAAGCPTVAVFGETDPALWAPRGHRVRVVIAPESTLAALDERVVLSECRVFLQR